MQFQITLTRLHTQGNHTDSISTLNLTMLLLMTVAEAIYFSRIYLL